MKKILVLFLIFSLLLPKVKAQAAFSQTASNSTGAILNTSIDTMSVTLSHGFSNYSIQPVITKTSGTMAGTSVLYMSVNGTNWVASGDTMTLANAATNTTIWNKTKPVRYLRIITGGGTTVAGTAAAKITVGQ